MPTIRIDSDVWAWLQSNASPLEDTPNTVLRRIAGLDSHDVRPAQVRRSNNRSKHPDRDTEGEVITENHQFSGKQLIRMHDLPVRQLRYHKDGTFFERLNQFPGGLGDSEGYVLYDSELDIETDAEVSVGQKVNVHQGIRNHTRYRPYSKKGTAPGLVDS